MGFYITLVYIAFLILSPAVLFPQLGTYRIQLILAGLAALVTLFQAPMLGYPVRAIQNYLVAGFFFWACGAWVLHGWLGGVMVAALDLLPVMIVYPLLVAGLRKIHHFRLLAIVMVSVALYAGLRGILAFHYNSEVDTYILMQSTPNGILPRARFVGVLSDPNDLAQFFLTIVPMMMMLWKPRSPLRNLIFVMPLVVFLSYAVYLTHSRGVLVGLAVVLMVYLSSRFNPFIMSIGTAGFAVALVALNFSGGRSVSFGAGSDRIEAWGVGLGLLKSYPLHGAGYNSFADHHEVTAHNSFVLCFSELGIVGFFLWLAILVVCFKQLNSIVALGANNPRLRPLIRWVRMVQLSFTGFLATAWFLSRTYEALLWILVAMSTAMVELARREIAPDIANVQLASTQRRDLRERMLALLNGFPPPRWLPTTTVLQLGCIVLVYLMVLLRWAG